MGKDGIQNVEQNLITPIRFQLITAYKGHDTVREHLSVDTKVLVAGQLVKDGLGHATDTHLQACAVRDHLGW